MKTVPIDRVLKETDSHFTIFIKDKIQFEPGQFVMLWLPGVDEKPFTVSYYSKEEFGITIEKKGTYTHRLSQMKKGDLVGYRGPFGKGFEIKGKRILIIAGGCGIAPLGPLAEKISADIIQGSKTKKAILFRNRFKGVKYCTDDGSFGHHGFCTDIFELEKKRYDVVYCCGPELMMKKVFEICEERKIECQCSLERYMKCGIGICGSCVFGKYRVCADGPVFSSSKLRQVKDFGKSAQLTSGLSVKLSRYYKWRSK